VSSLQFSLPKSTSSPAEARRAFADFARGNDVGDVETLLIVLSELVSNAVEYGDPPIGIRIECRGWATRIEVSDALGDPDVVRPRHLRADESGGMGLRIVDAVSLGWGAHANRSGIGKTVWAELACGGHVPS
jgi:anti-sigma regulatory factor (Ser/Thr protein kinase)